MNRALLVSGLAIALLGGVTPASTISAEWVIVPATAEGLPPLVQRTAQEIGVELERQGQKVWSWQAATERFEREASMEPMTLSPDQLERWLADSQAGIRLLALGEHRGALRHLKRADQISQAERIFLTRDRLGARRVLDTCLYMVRLLLESDNLADARDHARRCAVIAPGTAPHDLMHPPATLALYEQARGANEKPRQHLIVESDREGCTVRINGVASGLTPLHRDSLVEGTYAVQVECREDEQGRIHSLDVGPGITKLRVHTTVEEAVHTRPMLRLQDHDSGGTHARRLAATRIAQALPARWVLFVSRPAPDVIALAAFDSFGNPLGCGRIPMDHGRIRSDLLIRAVRDIVEGHCEQA